MCITYAVFSADSGCNNTVSFIYIDPSVTKHEAFVSVADDKEVKSILCTP